MTQTEYSCVLELDGEKRTVALNDNSATCGSTAITLHETDNPGVYLARHNGEEIPVHVISDGVNKISISVRGYSYEANILRSEHRSLFDIINSSPAAKSRTVRIASPMPGMLKTIVTKDGAEVRKGDTLFTLEAMKMENAITSPIHGTVRNISVEEGQACEKGIPLCILEPLQ